MKVHHTFTHGLGRAAVGLAAAFALSAGLALLPAGSANAQSPNADLAFDLEDMRFILQQIEFAERHAAGELGHAACVSRFSFSTTTVLGGF